MTTKSKTAGTPGKRKGFIVNKYTARFTGRLSGAIGCFHSCTVEIEAENEEAARLKLYDTHDHIQGLRLEEQKEKTRQTPPPESGSMRHFGADRGLAG